MPLPRPPRAACSTWLAAVAVTTLDAFIQGLVFSRAFRAGTNNFNLFLLLLVLTLMLSSGGVGALLTLRPGRRGGLRLMYALAALPFVTVVQVGCGMCGEGRACLLGARVQPAGPGGCLPPRGHVARLAAVVCRACSTSMLARRGWSWQPSCLARCGSGKGAWGEPAGGAPLGGACHDAPTRAGPAAACPLSWPQDQPCGAPEPAHPAQPCHLHPCQDNAGGAVVQVVAALPRSLPQTPPVLQPPCRGARRSP